MQQKTTGYKAIENLRKRSCFPPEWNDIAELQHAADNALKAFLEERFRVAKNFGRGFLLSELFDRSVRTTETEHMDLPGIDVQKKIDMIIALDRMNSMLMIYSQYLRIIEPHIRQLARQNGRKTKILEIAAGAGGLALAIAANIRDHDLPAEITGSDIQEEYADYAEKCARQKMLPARFMVIDALQMEHIPEGCFDIILISQSLHHFTPGQLAVMIRRSQEKGASLFLGIDGHRGPEMLAGVPAIAMLQGIRDFMLDGYTSARKFYSELELDLIAETATRQRTHTIGGPWPLTVLTVPLTSDELPAKKCPGHSQRPTRHW